MFTTALRSKYQNNYWQRRRTLLRGLDNSVMKAGADPDVFLPEIHQLRDELGNSDEVVFTGRLTTITLDV